MAAPTRRRNTSSLRLVPPLTRAGPPDRRGIPRVVQLLLGVVAATLQLQPAACQEDSTDSGRNLLLFVGMGFAVTLGAAIAIFCLCAFCRRAAGANKREVVPTFTGIDGEQRTDPFRRDHPMLLARPHVVDVERPIEWSLFHYEPYKPTCKFEEQGRDLVFLAERSKFNPRTVGGKQGETRQVVTAQTDRPLSNEERPTHPVYFELEVNSWDGTEENPPEVTVGWATWPYPPFRALGDCEVSIGLRSNGKVYSESCRDGVRICDGFKPGDVVGAGYELVMDASTLGDAAALPPNVKAQAEPRKFQRTKDGRILSRRASGPPDAGGARALAKPAVVFFFVKNGTRLRPVPHSICTFYLHRLSTHQQFGRRQIPTNNLLAMGCAYPTLSVVGSAEIRNQVVEPFRYVRYAAPGEPPPHVVAARMYEGGAVPIPSTPVAEETPAKMPTTPVTLSPVNVKVIGKDGFVRIESRHRLKPMAGTIETEIAERAAGTSALDDLPAVEQMDTSDSDDDAVPGETKGGPYGMGAAGEPASGDGTPKSSARSAKERARRDRRVSRAERLRERREARNAAKRHSLTSTADASHAAAMRAGAGVASSTAVAMSPAGRRLMYNRPHSASETIRDTHQAARAPRRSLAGMFVDKLEDFGAGIVSKGKKRQARLSAQAAQAGDRENAMGRVRAEQDKEAAARRNEKLARGRPAGGADGEDRAPSRESRDAGVRRLRITTGDTATAPRVPPPATSTSLASDPDFGSDWARRMQDASAGTDVRSAGGMARLPPISRSGSARALVGDSSSTFGSDPGVDPLAQTAPAAIRRKHDKKHRDSAKRSRHRARPTKAST